MQILLGLGAKEDFITASGGAVTTDGDWKVHTFVNPGNFSVSQLGSGTPNAPNTVYYLVIGGGGGGGSHVGGGGGAGGLVSNHPDYGPRQSPVPSGGLPSATNFL